MSEIKPRSTQAKVKHTILKDYLNAWGGIIINGWREKSTTLHLIYVDCNASTGRFCGELEDRIAKRKTEHVFGSPIIGIQVLDALAMWARNQVGISIQINAILFEQERDIYDELKQSLNLAGLSQRMRETDDFFSLRDGQIAILNEDSTTMLSHIIPYTQAGFSFSFFTLDPYGPKGIPLTFVGDVVHQPRHDVIINMPYYDLLKKTGIVPKQNQSPLDEKLLKNYDAMFGSKKWQAIALALDTDALHEGQDALSTESAYNEKRDQAIEAASLELRLMHCYRDALLSVDQHLTVKSIGLHFPDKERTMYYLYLTTHDLNGALVMNKVLWEAGYQEHELRWELMELKKRGPQLTLFELPTPLPRTPARTSTEDIARHIHRLFQGKTVSRKRIYQALVDESYFANEIDKALNSLKKQKLASFDAPLSNRTMIIFQSS